MKRSAIPGFVVAAALAAVSLFLSARTARPQANTPAPPTSEASAAEKGAPPAEARGHKITVTFDYDFTKTPSCAPPKVKDKCVARFNIYDISAGVQHRAKLFSMPAPTGETKRVTGITVTTPERKFEPGRHLIGVATQEPDGTESDPRGCTVWVTIP